MLRRTASPRWARVGLAALLSAGALAASGPAQAAGAWITGSSLTPVEQRVAVSSGPGRTTLWTSLRFDASPGPMAIVVPAPPGASLDLSSDAWFEALEVATAARVFPPAGQSAFCPGKSGTAFEIDGQIDHLQTLHPDDVTVLPDANSVGTWADQAGLTIPPALQSALGGLSGVSFVAVRFTAPSGAGVTPALRISMPGTPAVLPLALTSAGTNDLRVTAFLFGQGEGDLIGGVKVAITPSLLVFRADNQTSNYETLRDGVLSSATDLFLIESTGHQALVDSTPIANGTAFVDPVVTTFFERAAAYGDGLFDAMSCIGTTTPVLDQAFPVAAVCPRAALGVVDPSTPCTESPGPGEIDPTLLRCGPGADDLALALSGLVPSQTWLTRQSLIIPGSGYGADTPLGFPAGTAVSDVLYAAQVDTSQCGDAGTHPGSSSSSGSMGTSSGTSSGHTSSGTSGGYAIGEGAADAIETIADAVGDVADSTDSCDCSSTSFGSGDSCNGSSDSSSDSSSTGSCSSSDSSSTDSCSGSSDGSSCSGSSDSSGACSGSSSAGDACSGFSGGGGDCNCAMPGRVRAPRMSVLLMMALAVVAPLRRRTRPRRARSISAK